MIGKQWGSHYTGVFTLWKYILSSIGWHSWDYPDYLKYFDNFTVPFLA